MGRLRYALQTGHGECGPRALLFYLVSINSGLNTKAVYGKSDGADHMANIVVVDGTSYEVDCTWDRYADYIVLHPIGERASVFRKAPENTSIDDLLNANW